MEDIVQSIKDNQLFENINENEIRSILKCSNATVESYQENQIVFEKEDTIQKMGIVLEGEFNLVAQKYSGTRVIITSLEKGDLFGEALVFSSVKKSPYDLVSSGNSKALLMPYGIFVNMCQEVCSFHKQLISNMLTILSDKIVMLNNKMTILNAETLKGRIALYLLSINKKTKTLTFNMPMNRQEMSEFLNVTRPSLSRELSNMQKDNIIEVYRSSVKIKDLERLKELAD